MSPPAAQETHTTKLLEALIRGKVRAIGGIVYDVDMKPLMSTTDMHPAVQELGKIGVAVTRTDSGGSPRWEACVE